ncbi:hypothetical protein [Streptomyces sp. NPDC088707]|uniref:hypothetical protein n=1 Tax=Streptomyces sp. NPDC088707 TaxID=3365871 RepID=UPI0037F8CEC1
MAEESITAWRNRAVFRLEEARRVGDVSRLQSILVELEQVHVALGERRVGTVEEQQVYRLARSTSTPVPELSAVGVNSNHWPLPQGNSPAVAEPELASQETQARISDLFASAGPLSDRRQPPDRYEARHRAQDGQMHQGRPLPWAIWDVREDVAVAYLPDKELAQYQAGLASDRVAAKRGRST